MAATMRSIGHRDNLFHLSVSDQAFQKPHPLYGESYHKYGIILRSVVEGDSVYRQLQVTLFASKKIKIFSGAKEVLLMFVQILVSISWGSN